MNERTINDNRISKDYKYLALYWALGFEPGSDGVFAKDYGDCRIRIEPESGRAEFSKPLTCLGGAYMSLKDDKAFVILRVDDNEKAVKELQACGVPLLCAKDITKI